MSGSMCESCDRAADMQQAFKERGLPLTTARWNRVMRWHSKCKGHAFCFCQHRVPRG